VKPLERAKQIEKQIARALGEQLSRVSLIQAIRIEEEPALRVAAGPVRRPDIVAHIMVRDMPVELICEVKALGYPKQVRAAIAQLHAYRSIERIDAVPLVGSSWLSPESRALCEEAGLGWIDLAGNCRIAFDGIYIERETAERPKPAARNFRSIFSPKSGRILRVLLRDPSRPWKVSDLAAASGVSLGQVSNVRSALIDREWAVADEAGLHLIDPEALLDAWRDEYEPVRGERSSWYTVLHGRELERALRNLLAHDHRGGHAMLAGLSAANWLAPYVRGNSTTSIYAEAEAVPRLVDALKLKPVSSGANVEIIVPDDPALLNERIDLPDAPPVAPPVLTYLDVSRLNDRGREAADYLREKLLTWR
jgi:hypothetical protein